MSRETSAFNVSVVWCDLHLFAPVSEPRGCTDKALGWLSQPPSLEFIFASSCTCANVPTATAWAFVRAVGTEVGLIRKPVFGLHRWSVGGYDVPPQPLVFALVQVCFPRATISESLLWWLRLLLLIHQHSGDKQQNAKYRDLPVPDSSERERERKRLIRIRCWSRRLDGLHGKHDRTHEPGGGTKSQVEPLPALISCRLASRSSHEQRFTHIICHKADIILMNANLTHVIRVTNEVSSWFWRETGLTNSWTITSEGDKRQWDCWAPFNLGTLPSISSWSRSRTQKYSQPLIHPPTANRETQSSPQLEQNTKQLSEAERGPGASYLFLRIKLLLENLKLCWGTHDMELPILPRVWGGGGFLPGLWNQV